jgi:acetyl/propionyl-CoA carboxylase alpha subunit
VRINVEDVVAGFVLQTGPITHLEVPQGVRWDSAVDEGSYVSPRFDSMIAKLIVHGDTRRDALDRLRSALDGLIVGGVATTAGFHRWLVDQGPMVEGRVTTRFLDEVELPTLESPGVAAQLAAQLLADVANANTVRGVWGDIGPFRSTPHTPTRRVLLRDSDRIIHECEISPDGAAVTNAAVVDAESGTVAVNCFGVSHLFVRVTRSEGWAPAAQTGHGHATLIAAPFPAVVAEVRVQPGEAVAGGDVLVVIEAMKVLHSLSSSGPGVVADVRIAPGDTVESQQILITFEVDQ